MRFISIFTFYFLSFVLPDISHFPWRVPLCIALSVSTCHTPANTDPPNTSFLLWNNVPTIYTTSSQHIQTYPFDFHTSHMHALAQFKVRQRRLDRSKILFYLFSLCTIPWYSYLVELSTIYVNPKTMEATLQCYFVMSIFFSTNYWSHIKHFIVHTSVYCARHIFSHVHWCIEPQLFSALCQKVFKSHIRMRMFTNPRLELATHNHQ